MAFLGLDPLLDRVDIGHFIQDEINALEDKIEFGLNAVFLGVNAEGNEEPARLVVVLPVPIDNGDLPFGFFQPFPKLSGDHGTAGAITQNNQIFHSPRLSVSLFPSFNKGSVSGEKKDFRRISKSKMNPVKMQAKNYPGFFKHPVNYMNS